MQVIEVPWAWLAFGLACWSVIANDSIQTLGGLISASHGRGAAHRVWMWAWVSAIATATIVGGWYLLDGDVSWGRLDERGLSGPPGSGPMVLAGPVTLVILTRMGIPVSTTFLILGSAAVGPTPVHSMLLKSLKAWGVALAWGALLWRILPAGSAAARTEWQRSWGRRALPVVTAGLWVSWLQQDVANLAVYLPRRLEGFEVAIFLSGVVASLAVLLWRGGSAVQARVEEKRGMQDPWAVTLGLLAYLVVLGPFTWVSSTPMSTTWAFVGLLGGRELALRGPAAWRMVARDGALLGIGLAVSMAVAVGCGWLVAEP